ncbi:MAG: hypothetical protein K6T86_05005 [Pirellulales bacterium]|nr:hypothetical protein [Pirellulales bacterium]
MKRWLLAMAVLAALFLGAASAQAHWGCRPYRPYGFSYGYYRPFAYSTYVYRPVYPYRSFVSGTPWFTYSYQYYSPGYSFGWSYGW